MFQLFIKIVAIDTKKFALELILYTIAQIH
jgi:hypothetical protein